MIVKLRVSTYLGITRSPFGDWRGRLAQLEERLVYTEKVGGSIPSSPTIDNPATPSPRPAAPSPGRALAWPRHRLAARAAGVRGRPQIVEFLPRFRSA